jgi:nitroreductase
VTIDQDAGNESLTPALGQLIRGRRSINLFTPEPVAVQELEDAIEIARWAPNHRLTEPWKFYIVGPSMKQAIARCAADYESESKGERAGEARYKRLMEVPAYFIVTSRIGTDELTDREDYAATCCAVQNLCLYLWQRGIGTKWTTGAITREPRFFDLLGIDAARETVVGFFWYGRPKVVPEQKRKDVADSIAYLE